MTPSLDTSKPLAGSLPYFMLFKAVWRYMGDYRKTYTLALIVLCISQCFYLLGPYVLGRLIDHIQLGIETKEALYKGLFLALVYFLITPCFSAFHVVGRIRERQGSFIVHQHYQDQTYEKVRQLPYSWHQDMHSGQLVDRIKKSAYALDNFAQSQYSYIGLLFNILGPILVLVLFFPWAAAACLVIGIVAVIIITRFDHYLVPLYQERNRLSHIESGVFNDFLSNIRTIITLRLGRVTQSELLSRYLAKKKPFWREIRLDEQKWVTIDHLADFFVAALIAMLIFAIYRGSALQIGSVVMLIQYLVRFSGVFPNVGGLYQQMIQQAADYQSAQIIDDEYASYIQQLEFKPSEVKEQDWSEIRLQDLRFAYKENASRNYAVNNLNFVLAKGEKIALVGQSGSGKSTLMALLRGLYDAENVTLDIDGQVHHTLYPFRRMTALIPQDPEIFENTIRYNITFGVDYPEDEVMKACRIACFDDVLTILPQGLDTDIREKGVNLSGGQKQRLALARGVFGIKESPLILLDEPTSSVDTKTESQIFDNLFQAFPDKTMIAAVHRLHLLPLFDRIIVMQEGEIAEEGTFAQLMDRKSFLHEMWTSYQNVTRKIHPAKTPDES